jgi:hypothetical protein
MADIKWARLPKTSFLLAAPALSGTLMAAVSVTPHTAAATQVAALVRTSAAPNPLADASDGPAITFCNPPSGAWAWPSVCSLRHPVCVHAPRAVAPSQSVATLASVDRAWDTLKGALRILPPDPDPEGAWHVYLVDWVTGGGDACLLERDPRTRFDRGLTLATVGRAIAPGCGLDLAAARAIARAAVFQASPATDEASARGESEALARLAAPCDWAADEPDEPDERAQFQAQPERALFDASSPAFERGTSRFYEWLDSTFAREPGALLRGVWALAPTRTPPTSWRWSAKPTGVDVLRGSLKGALGADSTLDDVIALFAVDRARESPGPRLAWHIGWPVAPRRLASPAPVSPTGASYVSVDREGAASEAKLRVEVAWEDYGRMRWFALKVDRAGRTTAVLPIVSLDRATGASMTVESLEGTDHVLLVGANVGSTDHPLDPDQAELGGWEPHGWLLTLAAQ